VIIYLGLVVLIVRLTFKNFEVSFYSKGRPAAGKSSKLNMLQSLFEEPYLNADIGKFIWILPTRYLERPL